MFARVPSAQMKAVETALKASRLDEAFNLAVAGGLLGQRRAMDILARMGAALLQRGQDRVLSRQFQEALVDFANAARCGLPAAKVAEWQDRARAAMASDERERADRDAALAEVRRKMEVGSLVGADEALERLPAGDAERMALGDAVRARRDEAKRAMAAAEVAMANGNVAAAARQVEKARDLDKNLAGIADTEMQLVEGVAGRAMEDFCKGRLSRAEEEIGLLGGLGQGRRERAELERVLQLAKEVAQALASDRYARASLLLGRLAQSGLDAAWIAEARGHLRDLELHRRALLEGPLGVIGGKDLSERLNDRTALNDETLPAALKPAAPQAPPVNRAPRVDGHALPRRMLLRIDGVGSFLLIRGSRVSIGRAGPNATADLPLVSDLPERQAEIVRAGEDYFIVSEGGVDLAGRNVDHALLRDGDRIRLSPRIRIKFRRPSLKSSAAALDLGEGVRTTSDCRRVLLWEGPILMGGTRECHVQLLGGVGDFVLMERGYRLYVRPMGPGGESKPVSLGEQTVLGALRFSVADWSRA